MELIKVSKEGALHFKLSDGRIGATYPSGYVRVSLKGNNSRMYQINKQIKVWYDATSKYGYNYNRVLIHNHSDRVRKLVEFNLKNCK